jgi:aerobic carbon-monoxide dehydrogenase medium subunit
VKPAPFEYVRPADLDAAVQALQDGAAKVLAGGQSLIPIMSMRLAAPGRLVDINGLPGMDVIAVDESGVRIGALVRHRALELDEAAFAAVPLLRQALANVAHPTIRNRGTTVGSIVHADPAAEMPAVLRLLGGTLDVHGVDGARTIAATNCFVGPMESTVGPTEVAVSAFFPRPAGRTGSAWLELARRHGDYAVAGVGALVCVADDGGVEWAKVVLISVAATPVVVDLAAALPTDGTGAGGWDGAAELIRSSIDPETDIHATADYRRHLSGVLATRALALARADADGRAAA